MSERLFGKFVFGSLFVGFIEFVVYKNEQNALEKYEKWQQQIDDEYDEYMVKMMFEELCRDQRVEGNCNLN